MWTTWTAAVAARHLWGPRTVGQTTNNPARAGPLPASWWAAFQGCRPEAGVSGGPHQRQHQPICAPSPTLGASPAPHSPPSVAGGSQLRLSLQPLRPSPALVDSLKRHFRTSLLCISQPPEEFCSAEPCPGGGVQLSQIKKSNRPGWAWPGTGRLFLSYFATRRL